MRTMLAIACLFVWLSVGHADEPAPSADPSVANIQATPMPPDDAVAIAETAAVRKVVVYRLRNVASVDAAKSLNEALQPLLKSPPQQAGVVADSPVVVVPEPATNSLIVCAAPPYAEKIAAILKGLDTRPRQITIQATISLVDADGKRKLLARPQISTLEGQQAVVAISTAELGIIEIELTPRTIHSDVEDAEAQADDRPPSR